VKQSSVSYRENATANLQAYNLPMTQEATDLLKKAMTLSADERIALAASLMDSVDRAEEESIEAAWNDEIARRIEDLDSGGVKPIPWEEVRAEIAAKLANGR